MSSPEEHEARRRAAFERIRQWGDPVLRTACRPVARFDEALRAQVEQMTLIMEGAVGAGLAAPQVGVPNRVFVYRPPAPPGAGEDAAHEEAVVAVVNPRIEVADPELVVDLEGCLSLGRASVAVEVPRPRAVVLEGFDAAGAPLRIEAEGRHARVLQHETDHLDGVLMLERTSPEQRREAVRALREGRPWFPPGVEDEEPAEAEGEAAGGEAGGENEAGGEAAGGEAAGPGSGA